MNQPENDLFEAELRRLKPAPLPDDLASRLEARAFAARPPKARPNLTTPRIHWPRLFRWLAPAAATMGLVLLAALWRSDHARHTPPPLPADSAPSLLADQVEIDRQWLGSFDAVAQMPEGEPVRFRFQQWMDAVTLRDSVRGVEVVQRTPRIEVVPVSFVSY